MGVGYTIGMFWGSKRDAFESSRVLSPECPSVPLAAGFFWVRRVRGEGNMSTGDRDGTVWSVAWVWMRLLEDGSQ